MGIQYASADRGVRGIAMRHVCAWCLKDMGPVKESIHPDNEISHGICSSCRDNVIFQEGVSLQRYIDSFAIPIFVVDGNVTVTAVNRRACEVLGKEPTAIVQHLGGDVFECEHSRLPEGCGKTIHCSGCTIRKTVTKCFATSKPQSMIPAYLNPDSPSSKILSITTVKVADMVMLRVDHLE
jgi:hypothetical protein